MSLELVVFVVSDNSWTQTVERAGFFGVPGMPSVEDIRDCAGMELLLHVVYSSGRKYVYIQVVGDSTEGDSCW
jgi:hypothetical protein